MNLAGREVDSNLRASKCQKVGVCSMGQPPSMLAFLPP